MRSIFEYTGPAAIVVVSLLISSCGEVTQEDETISAEEISLAEAEADSLSRLFCTADSLALYGYFDCARDTLVRMLQEYRDNADQILFRLLGLYHGRACEPDFVALLDSLEMAGSGPLTGWKISALDLSGEPGEALVHAMGYDSLLSGWLRWEVDSTSSILPISGELSPQEVFALAMSRNPESLTRSEIRMLAQNALLFPSVEHVLLEALESNPDTTFGWRIELLRPLDRSSGMDLLLLENLARADSGSVEFWLQYTNELDGMTAVAAAELLQNFQGEFRPSWRVEDHLIAMGLDSLARAFSGLGDPLHRVGAEMALLLHDQHFSQLLELASSNVSGVPDSLAARASLFRAHALKGLGRPASEYYAAYFDFARSFPWHPLAREMAYNVGKYHDCEQEWEPGAEAYLTSLRSSGSWGGDERAHWRCGFCLYMSGRLREADSLWLEGCERWPYGYWRDEMLFWRARLAGDQGRFQLRDSLLTVAAVQHPWEFYGMLAGMRSGSGSELEFPVPGDVLMEDPACSLAVAMTARGYGVAAAQMLLAGELSCKENRARALSLMGRHGQCLALLREVDSRLREDGDGILPDSLLIHYFPSPYSDLARMATDTLVLGSDMLQGIMREESYFNRWVVSRAGARGVVQLMPTTAADVARWYGLPPLEEEDFFDPAASVPYGALYIDRQVRSFDGEYPIFLAAYNAGPGNATRWVDMHGWNTSDPEMYIEQITYRETRMYVKKVLRSAWIYERR